MAKPIVDRTRLLLGFDVLPGTSLNITTALKKKLSKLELSIDGDESGKSRPRVQHTWRHLWVSDAKGRRISDARVGDIRDALRPGLSWTAPVNRDPNARTANLSAVFPDVLLVAPRPGIDPDRIGRALGAYGLREWAAKSQYLGRWRYFVLDHADTQPALELAPVLLKQQAALIADVSFEVLGHDSPLLFDPNDIFYDRQWNLPRIGAPAAWDISDGSGIVVAVLDSGCDHAHPDLFARPGINLDDMIRDGSPVGTSTLDRTHGTLVSGVIGARLNNIIGIAGIAGGCELLPLAASAFTLPTLTMGLRYALRHGARVINISAAFQEPAYYPSGPEAIEAIEDTTRDGLVICASAGNGDAGPMVFPARHPDVLACGGSDHLDVRWRLPSLRRGSDYGDEEYLGRPTGVSVVAPAADIYSTDISGPEGLTPGPTGDYQYFNETSAAAPHVAAAAALLLSSDGTLSAADIRRIIERTAEKTGVYAYTDVAGYPNGTRHPEMGYGRLSLHRSVELGDVMIADWPGDDGVEPSTPPDGVYWETSDLVVRPSDDHVFDPANPDESSVLIPGRDHTVYVRVRNVGPFEARNVHVDACVTPWVGTEFIYPLDWTTDDPLHLRPAPVRTDFDRIIPGSSELAVFTLSAAQVDVAAGWSAAMPWHPCLLGVTTADNDYAFHTAATGAALQTRRNNLAQRNLSVISARSDRSWRFPFVVGHPADPETSIDVIIEGNRIVRDGIVRLLLDDKGDAFPLLLRYKALVPRSPRPGKVAGGSIESSPTRTTIRMNRSRMVVRLTLPRPGRYALSLLIQPPRDARPSEQFRIWVAQRSPRRGIVTGGASWIHTNR